MAATVALTCDGEACSASLVTPAVKIQAARRYAKEAASWVRTAEHYDTKQSTHGKTKHTGPKEWRDLCPACAKKENR